MGGSPGVFGSPQFDAVEITFGDQSSTPITPVRYLPEDFYATIVRESPEKELDYAILQIKEPEFRGHFQFAVAPAEGIEVGGLILRIAIFRILDGVALDPEDLSRIRYLFY